MSADGFFGFLVGIFASILFASIVGAFQEEAKESAFRDQCTNAKGVVLRMEGKQVCLPPQVLELKANF